MDFAFSRNLGVQFEQWIGYQRGSNRIIAGLASFVPVSSLGDRLLKDFVKLSNVSEDEWRGKSSALTKLSQAMRAVVSSESI